MSSLPDQYSPEQVISAHIKQVIIPIGTFINLRSLIIAYKHDWKDNCLIMIKEISKLSQLINFELVSIGYKSTSTDNEAIDCALSHSSLQRFILLADYSNPKFCAWRKKSSLKMRFAGPSLFNSMALLSTPQYHIKHLNIQFKIWSLHSLAKLLSALPSLVTIKIGGIDCFHVDSWLNIDVRNQIFESLPSLEQVNIAIWLALRIETKKEAVENFTESVENKFEKCKRVNLKVGKRNQRPYIGYLEVSASLNMN